MKKFSTLLFVIFLLNAHSQSVEEIQDQLERLNQINALDQQSMLNQEPSPPTLVNAEIEDNTNKNTDDKFGFDFINTLPTSVSATSDLPIPGIYKVSLNDEIEIILSGTKKSIFVVRVGLDGNILFPEIGPIQAAGESFDSLKNKLRNIIDTKYVGTNVDLSIKNLSAKKINLIGAVEQPGTYLVNPFTTIINSLAYGGGMKEYASLRTIKVVKKDGSSFKYDAYEFLVFGNRENDNILDSGDTVVVSGTDNFINIGGQVIRPHNYEFTSSDSFRDLVNFAMGFKNNANTQDLYAEIVGDGKLQFAKFSMDEDIGNRILASININKLSSSTEKDIQIRGNGVNETILPKGKYKTLDDLVEILQFSDEIYPFFFKVKQQENNGLKTTTSYFSLYDQNTYANYELKENVEVYFFSRGDILEELKIDSDGIQFIDDQNYVIKDIIIGKEIFRLPLIGKTTPEIIFDYIGSDELIDDKKVSVADLAKVYQSAYKSEFDSKNILRINFPKKEFLKFPVEIKGEVNNPGTYYANTSTTLFDLYEMAAGFTKNANQNAIFFSREELRNNEKEAVTNTKKIIIDLMIDNLANSSAVNAALPSTAEYGVLLELIGQAEAAEFPGRLSGDFSIRGQAKDIFLKEGDLIIVPNYSNFISVIGEVNNPTSTVYDGNFTYQDYIENSGGLTKYADKQNIYVLKANGYSYNIDSGYFTQKLYLDPGDTLVIPKRLDNISTITYVTEITKTLADIALSAAVFKSLNTN
tara:strand:+ start:22882 stop:25140 length:2259 start_codon:yes stop_codon:yes gene_type:complete